MCGIAGVSGKDAEARVQKIITALSHRGPDGEGTWSSNPSFALGHRRLAINDLSALGNQPMVSEDKTVVISVNGEIYNYPELRTQLESLGARFQSTSDSEVVIHAWNYWKEDSFQKFNGMFAIALYDRVTDQLFLARDRLGIKPIYFFFNGQELVFASEIKGILAGINNSRPGIDPVGLNQYLTYQNYFGNRTLREDIKLLEPGCYLLHKLGEGIQLKAFWNLTFQSEDPKIDFSSAVEKYRQTVSDSVARHLMSDVPVASYLSAGFDSATIANRAAHLGLPPVCYTGSFTEGGWYDETSVAKKMALHNGSDHVSVSIDHNNLTNVLDDLVIALDEPRMGMGAFPQYCVAQRVAQSHKVILTGHGGDELFSGYPVFKLVQMKQDMFRASLNFLRQLKTLKLSELPHLAYFFASDFRSRPYRQYLPVLNGSLALQQGLTAYWSDAIRDLRADDELINLDRSCEKQSEILYNHYLKAYLNGLLIVEDKLSMAHSLESRTPMLDNEMLNLSLSIPQNIKMHNGVLKAIIKEGGRPWLAPSLYQQPKRGFPTPLRFWLRGPLREWFQSRLCGPESGLGIIFQQKWLETVCDRYLNSSKKFIRPLDEIQSQKMWQLLNLESWLRNAF